MATECGLLPSQEFIDWFIAQMEPPTVADTAEPFTTDGYDGEGGYFFPPQMPVFAAGRRFAV